MASFHLTRPEILRLFDLLNVGLGGAVDGLITLRGWSLGPQLLGLDLDELLRARNELLVRHNLRSCKGGVRGWLSGGVTEAKAAILKIASRLG